eukprot:Gb_36224 [translate_table: standard]
MNVFCCPFANNLSRRHQDAALLVSAAESLDLSLEIENPFTAMRPGVNNAKQIHPPKPKKAYNFLVFPTRKLLLQRLVAMCCTFEGMPALMPARATLERKRLQVFPFCRGTCKKGPKCLSL